MSFSFFAFNETICGGRRGVRAGMSKKNRIPPKFIYIFIKLFIYFEEIGVRGPIFFFFLANPNFFYVYRFGERKSFCVISYK